MLGLMLVGTEFALRGIDAAGPLIPRPPHWPRTRDDWVRWKPMAMLVVGTVLIAHVVTGEAAVAACGGVRGDGPGLPNGRNVQGIRARQRRR